MKSSPLRQCFNADGNPKKRHETLEEARAFLSEHHGPNYHAYPCEICLGFHMGEKVHGPAFCVVDGCDASVPHDTWLCKKHEEQHPQSAFGKVEKKSWSAFRDAKTRERWKAILLARQSNRCALCGHFFAPPGTKRGPDGFQRYLPTFDHIIPKARGGPDELENFRIVHEVCNRLRADGTRPWPSYSVPKHLRAHD